MLVNEYYMRNLRPMPTQTDTRPTVKGAFAREEQAVGIEGLVLGSKASATAWSRERMIPSTTQIWDS